MMASPARSSTANFLAALVLASGPLWIPTAASAADAEAAQALARQNNCYRCHGVDTAKVGPSWKSVAARLKSTKDPTAFLINHLTTGRENHPVVKAKSPDDIKNLVEWLLSL